jgi:DNA-binding MarR family transcriptional regulator
MRIEKFLETSPLFNLAVTHDEIIGDLQRRLSKEGVHFLEALVITGVFFEERALRPTELARAFSSSKSNMSHTLRGLEKRGLVERKTSAEDARAYFFSLTKEAKRKAPRLIKIFDSTQSQIEKAVAGKKVNQSLKAFRRIYRNLRFPN